MKKRRNNSNRASTLQIALSTGLISISAILLAIAAPTNTKKAPRQDLSGFQLEEGADASTTLGNSSQTRRSSAQRRIAITPDAAPTNTKISNIGVTNSSASIVPGTTDIGNHTDDGATLVALPFPAPYNSPNRLQRLSEFRQLLLLLRSLP